MTFPLDLTIFRIVTVHLCEFEILFMVIEKCGGALLLSNRFWALALCTFLRLFNGTLISFSLLPSLICMYV